MRQKRTWNDNIMYLVRDVLYPSVELKELMLIPPQKWNDLASFFEKYVVNDPVGEEILIDEKVRILYYCTEGYDIGHSRVRTKYLEFDIFVKRANRYDLPHSGIKGRDKAITQKIQELLTDQRYVSNMRFSYVDDYELSSRTVGYARHHIIFSYKMTH